MNFESTLALVSQLQTPKIKHPCNNLSMRRGRDESNYVLKSFMWNPSRGI